MQESAVTRRGQPSTRSAKAMELINVFYPHVTVGSISRALCKMHPMLFKDFESARALVRLLVGSRGKRNKKWQRVAHKSEPPKSFGKTPKQHAAKHIRLTAQHNRVLLISDLHIPYHDEAAIEAAIEFGLENDANCIVINGDLIDNHGLSRFEKDIEARSPSEEFQAVRDFFAYLRERFPTQKIIWAEGNHDARYDSYFKQHAPELVREPHFSLQSVVHTEKYNIQFLPGEQLIYAGALSISHGHKILKGVFAPVNAARGVFIKTHSHHIVGHTHSRSEHLGKTIDSKKIGCWSTGCLCDLNPKYDPHTNKHVHGFAFITFEASGKYHVDNYLIDDGEIM